MGAVRKYHVPMPKSDQFIAVEAAAHSGAFGNNPIPSPTEAQCAAGNYKMGRVSLYGLSIAIEQPRGTYRTGVDAKTGKRWTNRMAAHYGYFERTKGADGDGVDCFVGFYPQSESAYVINQFVNGAFDEAKVMIAFPDEESARRAYLGSYDRGWNGLKSIVPVSISQLKWWLKHGDMRRPINAENLPYEGLEAMNNSVQWNSEALPKGQTIDHVLYDIRRADAGDNLLLDSVCLSDIIEDSDGAMAFDALVAPYASLERKMELIKFAMTRAGHAVTPVAIQITDPFKQRGVANVAVIFELSDGQTVSIFFHNPDVTPNKMAGTDELISWKWLLNKKDITIVVAPERGEDLNIREVARRIMKLAEKNSPAFMRANVKRSETMQRIEGVKAEIVTLEADLKKAMNDLEAAKLEAEDRALKAPGKIVQDIRAAAYAQGMEAFASGSQRVVPEGMSIEQMTAFYAGWDAANIAAPIPDVEIAAPELPVEFGIDAVREAMSGLSQTAAWWSVPEINNIIESGVRQGWLRRPSTTQVEWTDSGSAAVDVENGAKSEEPDDVEYSPENNQEADEALVAPENASGYLKKLVDKNAELVAQLKENGADYPSVEQFMADVASGNRSGFSVANLLAKKADYQEKVDGVNAGTVTPRSVVGTGGTKKSAIAWLTEQVDEIDIALNAGGIMDTTNLGNYNSTLRDALKGGDGGFKSDEQIAAEKDADDAYRSQRDAEESALQEKAKVSRNYSVGVYGDMRDPLEFKYTINNDGYKVVADLADLKTPQEKYDHLANSTSGYVKQMDMQFNKIVDFNNAKKAGAQFGYFEIAPRLGYSLVTMIIDLASSNAESTDEEINVDIPTVDVQNSTKTEDSAPSLESMIAEVKTHYMEEIPIDAPEGWIIMNAPRPLLGTKVIEGGEFLTGRFYAAIDPNDSVAQRFVQENIKLDAVVVLHADIETQTEMALEGAGEYRAAYEAMASEKRTEAVKPLIRRIQGKQYAEAKAFLDAAKSKIGANVSPPTTSEDPQVTSDKALYQSVIDGSATDILAPELADLLEAAYYRHEGSAEMDSMFEQAVNSYQAAMLAATANLA